MSVWVVCIFYTVVPLQTIIHTKLIIVDFYLRHFQSSPDEAFQ